MFVFLPLTGSVQGTRRETWTRGPITERLSEECTDLKYIQIEGSWGGGRGLAFPA
jgi:hypothetical protein